MMWQYLIVGAVIVAALILTGRRLIRFFINPHGKCDGCASAGSDCSLEDLKREIASKK